MPLTVPVTGSGGEEKKKNSAASFKRHAENYVKISSRKLKYRRKYCVKLDHLLLRRKFTVRTEGPCSLMLFFVYIHRHHAHSFLLFSLQRNYFHTSEKQEVFT